MSEKFIKAQEVAQVLEVSVPYAYKVIRQLNEELANKGFPQFRVESAVSISTKECTTAIFNRIRGKRNACLQRQKQWFMVCHGSL